MRTAEHNARVAPVTRGFNYNKLQAVACMLASAATSIGLTWYAITRLF
ncbi:hypothetical protein [Noviherbaspirillum aridicola]|uniref:Uncharacterized protein n=1 Tax=Noviherbaspirillum aridicola TaxID=2849687 RepID=A0ABQ4Q9Z3_9BURK|nr:hypothetical protein [Noviherbaspirillum aridicola]GIZ53590.1 hypothetical protein NCCP691_36040 [Noviherbaspirillum aridicola]